MPSTPPHIPQTNGVAENAVRKVTEGTSCALEQSGFSHVLVTWVAEHSADIQLLSDTFGARADKLLPALIDHCLSINLPGASDAGISGLEDPAVIVFAFGTGDKIGAGAGPGVGTGI